MFWVSFGGVVYYCAELYKVYFYVSFPSQPSLFLTCLFSCWTSNLLVRVFGLGAASAFVKR